MTFHVGVHVLHVTRNNILPDIPVVSDDDVRDTDMEDSVPARTRRPYKRRSKTTQQEVGNTSTELGGGIR